MLANEYAGRELKVLLKKTGRKGASDHSYQNRACFACAGRHLAYDFLIAKGYLLAKRLLNYKGNGLKTYPTRVTRSLQQIKSLR